VENEDAASVGKRSVSAADRLQGDLPVELVPATATHSHAEAYAWIVVGLFSLAGIAAHVLGRRVHVPE
jgi:hypothetical protein